MTIKELEGAVGMTRANIRFYEDEGLLCPARGENGYRNYSDGDVETLERIKLLRRLHLGLEEIKALQAGTLALPDALGAQLRKLEADQAALDRAKDVCGRLRETGTAYAALDPKPWLKELERAPAPASERYAPPADRADPVPGHPWRRLFARGLDLALYTMVLTALSTVVWHLPAATLGSTFFRLVQIYFGYGMMFLLEPVFLHFWGTTPGKWIFGIAIRDGEGEKLRYSAAFRRTAGVFGKGEGYGIPIYSLWRNWKCYKTVTDCERCDWEWTEEGLAPVKPEKMTIPDSAGRCVAFVAARAALYGLALLLTAQSLMPPCRGELTLAEFCQNMNFYNDYLSLEALGFTPEGKREEVQGRNWAVWRSEEVYEEEWSPLVENGVTVGFQYTLHAEDGVLYPDYTPQTLGTMAYAGALPEVNAVNFQMLEWVKQVANQDRWEFDRTYRGVRLTQTARFQGVDMGDQAGGVVFAPEGERATLDLVFSVRRE